MRLQQFIASCGLASRRGAEALIVEGRVTVNDETAQIGDRIDPLTDVVRVDGRILESEAKVYILLNKPRGLVTTARDTHGRGTVLDGLGALKTRVFPVGRLDLDVDGALLLTNDGDLAYTLTHPRFEVTKTYHAWVRGNVSLETASRLARGVLLEDGMTAPGRVRILARARTQTQIELEIHEGRNREVKRMCKLVGHPVKQLTRIAFAGLSVGSLPPGAWRVLTRKEIEALRAYAQPIDTGKPPRNSRG
jgi:pseudouridine synthase